MSINFILFYDRTGHRALVPSNGDRIQCHKYIPLSIRDKARAYAVYTVTEGNTLWRATVIKDDESLPPERREMLFPMNLSMKEYTIADPILGKLKVSDSHVEEDQRLTFTLGYSTPFGFQLPGNDYLQNYELLPQ